MPYLCDHCGRLFAADSKTACPSCGQSDAVYRTSAELPDGWETTCQECGCSYRIANKRPQCPKCESYSLVSEQLGEQIIWPPEDDAAFHGNITRSTSLGGNYPKSSQNGWFMRPDNKGCWQYQSVNDLHDDDFDTEAATVSLTPKNSPYVDVEIDGKRALVVLYRGPNSWLVRCSGEASNHTSCKHLDAVAHNIDELDAVQPLDGVYGELKEPRKHFEDGEAVVAVAAFGGPSPFASSAHPTPRLFTVCKIEEKDTS